MSSWHVAIQEQLLVEEGTVLAQACGDSL
jgi:hypothetical protein